MATIKYSRQREAIKDFLHTRKDHPTAEVVYDNVRLLIPNISLGTVYRNLSLLVDMGEIIKIPSPDGLEHFDACTDTHYHFACTKCGGIIDLEVPDLSLINSLAAQNFNGTIEGHSIYFYGTCENCK